ncbi:MAG: UbiA family prenyltransferase [Candidatus Thermoplasmatota archaeon]|nr:UbiA family prenyltransferase [Candidatus Thermoplasmatota archaeon]MBS3801821.1 UbiA family prenyltransferase [Candidatus Thermoplasmatota archaeon]
MIREYLKLARSFNAVLTGISPVMGAIAMQQYNILILLILFLIGFFGHTFGFVFNDIIDYKIDKTSKEISDRPLISGTISLKNAWIFALFCILLAFFIAVGLSYISSNYFPLIILAASASCIILYDLISKKFPFMDILVALGIFFFILYGASTQVQHLSDITLLAWFVCILGSIQVLFMQIVAGGLKDIENDYQSGANTAAVKLGVRVKNKRLYSSKSFQLLAFTIQIIDIILIFTPFFIIEMFTKSLFLTMFQLLTLGVISGMMLFLSHQLMNMGTFNRKKARTIIGSHYMINFALVPILLMTLNPWAGILVFFPALGFILSNLILHGTLLQPKTM